MVCYEIAKKKFFELNKTENIYRGRWGKTAQRGKTDHQPSRLNRCWYLLLYALTMFVFLRNNGHLELMLLGCIAFELLRKMLFFVKPI